MPEYKEHNIEWTSEKVSRLWDYYSKTSGLQDSYFTKQTGSVVLKMVQSIIGSIDGKTVLDFGCGPAYLAQHMARLKINPKKYIGLDFSEKTIDKADLDYGFTKEFFCVKTLPSAIEDDCVDCCFLLEVLEHLDDDHLDNILREIYRVLNKEGFLIVTVPNNENLEKCKRFCPDCGCIYHQWQHVRSFNKHSLIKILYQNGFSDCFVKETNFFNNDSSVYYIYNTIISYIKRSKRGLLGVFKKHDPPKKNPPPDSNP